MHATVNSSASNNAVAAFAGKYSPREFRGCFDQDCSNNLALYRGAAYYVKSSAKAYPAEKDYLGCLLAKALFNVPEVVRPCNGMHTGIEGIVANPMFFPRGARSRNARLVRLCQEYRKDELPIQDLTTAVAAEIVFSVWIGRRDAHNSNRVYVDGVPMFFDFGAAFGLETAEDFFRGGSDAGYVQNWRLWEIPKTRTIETIAIRNLELGKPLTLHPVHDIGGFWASVDHYAGVVGGIGDETIRRAIVASGFDDAAGAELYALLAVQRRALKENLERIKTTMAPVSAPA